MTGAIATVLLLWSAYPEIDEPCCVSLQEASNDRAIRQVNMFLDIEVASVEIVVFCIM
jgi:hypothetical protein